MFYKPRIKDACEVLKLIDQAKETLGSLTNFAKFSKIRLEILSRAYHNPENVTIDMFLKMKKSLEKAVKKCQ